MTDVLQPFPALLTFLPFTPRSLKHYDDNAFCHFGVLIVSCQMTILFSFYPQKEQIQVCVLYRLVEENVAIWKFWIHTRQNQNSLAFFSIWFLKAKEDLKSMLSLLVWSDKSTNVSFHLWTEKNIRPKNTLILLNDNWPSVFHSVQ